MKGRYWLYSSAAACLLILAFVLWPTGERVIEENRETVKNTNSVNFEELQRVNKDIYAWLHIPEADISEPLLQREGDGFYYLTHNSTGEVDVTGALFTESSYNHKDFSDAATVIYGKNAASGRQFGALQASYSSLEDLKKNGEILIYLPGGTFRYQAFAAAPFRSYHLLHYFDFSNETRFQAFLQAVRSMKAVDANWNEDIAVRPDDSLLILSTTRSGNVDDSYLVLAKRILEE